MIAYYRRFVGKLVVCLFLFNLLSLGFCQIGLANTNEPVKDSSGDPYIDYLVQRDGVKGYPDGSFHPERTITRAELAVMCSKAVGLTNYKPEKGAFSDVLSTHWAFEYIESAVKSGFIKGYSDRTFHPSAPVSRAEMAAFLIAFKGLVTPVTVLPTGITDVNTSWAKNQIAAALNSGIMIMQSISEFAPDREVTRGQAACSIAMMINLSPVADTGDTLLTAFASNTPVAYDCDQYKSIDEFQPGDQVWASDNQLNWSQKTVKFSQGTGDYGTSSVLVKVTYMAGDQSDNLLVTRNQIFLMPNGKLNTADRLVPGKDSLVMYDGSQAPVTQITIGTFKKGVHHISTSITPAESPDGHLLSAKGVVVGDYSLQLAVNRPSFTQRYMVDRWDTLPFIGTKEYSKD